jgi:prolipoprotein diacylglyceryltransferase
VFAPEENQEASFAGGLGKVGTYSCESFGVFIGCLYGVIIAYMFYSPKTTARLPTIHMAFGRWGNFSNQELYGEPIDLPFGVLIDGQYRLADVAQYGRFHPAFLYESLWNLLAFFVLLLLARHYYTRLKDGDLLTLFLIFHAVGRIGTEMVRFNSRIVIIGGWNVPIASLVSVGITRWGLG